MLSKMNLVVVVAISMLDKAMGKALPRQRNAGPFF